MYLHVILFFKIRLCSQVLCFEIKSAQSLCFIELMVCSGETKTFQQEFLRRFFLNYLNVVFSCHVLMAFLLFYRDIGRLHSDYYPSVNLFTILFICLLLCCFCDDLYTKF